MMQLLRSLGSLIFPDLGNNSRLPSPILLVTKLRDHPARVDRESHAYGGGRKRAHQIQRRLCLFIFIHLALISTGQAGTITAASCSQQNVQTAISAAVAGDTVAVPTGTCTWTSQISWMAPANVTLRGAGNTSVGGGDQTVIIDNYASNNSLLSITTNSSGTFRLTGFTFKGGTGGLKQNGIIALRGQNHQTRIDHNHIDMSIYSASGQIGIRNSDWIYGVMDHNLCDGAGGVNECINVEMEGFGGQPWGDGSWAADTAFGTSNFFFVEDNTFNDGIYVDDCSDGGRIVIRHNIINHGKAQTHPTGSGPRFRGCRASEFYQNTLNGNPTCNGGAGFNNCGGFFFWMSSGTLLIWGNNAPVVNSQAQSGYSFVISMHSMRKDNSTYPQTATPNGWGYCGTSFSGIGSNWDQNSNGSTGYACMDQPGQGKGDLLANNFPNVTNTATGCTSSSSCAWPRQALEPVYEWLNTFIAVPNNPSGNVGNASSSVLVQNRDFYTYAASFTGSTGVGSGALAHGRLIARRRWPTGPPIPTRSINALERTFGRRTTRHTLTRILSSLAQPCHPRKTLGCNSRNAGPRAISQE